MTGRRVAVVAALLVAGACAGNDDAPLAPWYGRHIDALVDLWGPPDASHRFRDGRQSVKYSYARILSDVQYRCTTQIGTDAKGIIRSASQDGNEGGCDRFLKSKALN